MHKPILYITCGIPGSGKSTWVKKFLPETAYISRDAIRFSLVSETEKYFSKETEVFKIFIEQISKCLKNGHNVIADATHLNFKSRNKTISAINKMVSNYEIIFIVLDTKKEICLERNAKRIGREKVPKDVIEDMYCNFKIPKKTEFDNIKQIWEIKEGI